MEAAQLWLPDSTALSSILVQARQRYGVWLPTSPSRINVKCRLCGALTGKDMVYDRQRYALNHTVVRHNVAAVGKFMVADCTLAVLLHDLSVQQLPHLGW